MKNNVCGIIVTYNSNHNDLQLLIGSLTDQVSHIIIVDNNSANEFKVENSSCEVEFIRLTANKGIGEAQNLGVDYAIKLGYEFVCLFDQDSRLAENFISSLLNAYQDLTSQGKSIGALGPLIVDERSGKQFPFYTYDGLVRKVIDPSTSNEPYIKTHQLISSGTFINTSVWKVSGGNHTGFFLEYVDTDWCLRVVKLGYEIYGVREAKLIHKLGDDRRKLLNRFEVPVHANYRYFYVFRNGVFCSLYRPFPISWRLYNLIRLTSFFFIMLLIKKDKLKLIRYVFLGINDGIRKNFSRKIF